ncbi:hypothetical protein NS365_22550 [Aureimonas ureilytica]|uniref:SEFIR domain-containing protein n=1 Tax=Aureimonas ureilytica TaxID=401562 RepID=A0A175RGG9_9HYPH|nr:SEFIR domain-containing protein [Aureimonas ureilytica]KTR02064.1 hypothetical protein NS365_22550 [Aureimonas ureilytica]
MSSPKVFVSYSWSSPDYLGRVMKLVEDLSGDGVHVVIDKYDLREGNDANAFMEQMVTSDEIKKVILLCDPIYADKANKRTGGVGTEAQIVTSEIFKQTEQSKFVAVIMDRTEADEIRTPAFYTSRIYIDLSRDERYTEEYEKLVRWIFDQPLHVRPPLGAKPAFLNEEKRSIDLGTASRQRRALDAVRAGHPSAVAALNEYLDAMSHNFERLRLPNQSDVEAVKSSIENFIPYRDEFLSVIDVVASQSGAADMYEAVHRFFERIAPYSERPESMHQWNSADFDNFRFITYEMFLSSFAITLKRENFMFSEILAGDYYDSSRERGGDDRMVSFNLFLKEVFTIEEENNRAERRYYAPLAPIIKNRLNGSILKHSHLMQADFVLWLVSKKKGHWWYPMNCLYGREVYGPFEVFARSKSRKYFDRFKSVLGVRDVEEFKAIVAKILSDPRGAPQWGFDTLNAARLSGFENIATAP